MNHPSTPVLGIDLHEVNQKKKFPRLLMISGVALMTIIASFFSTARQESLAAGSATSFLLSIEGKSADINIEANKAFSLTAKALDNNLATADSYVGTIAFSSTDTRARLPSPYTFTSTDKGEKTFNLALTLLSTGPQTISLKDSTNSAIVGEIAVNVTAGNTNTGTTTQKPVITNPTNDSTVNKAQLDITGTTTPDVQVSIFDADKLLATVNADRSGNYTYTTDALIDGTHTISVEVTNSQGQKSASDKVQVRIDTAPPVLQSVIVTPLEVEGTQKTTITVNTEPQLTSVKAAADQRTITLAALPDRPGTYTGEFIAPQAPGLYPVDIEVTDKFNNTSKYRAQATLKVKAVVAPTPNQAPIVSVNADIQTGRSPLTVQFHSNATDSDGRIVSYLWNFGDGNTSTEANPKHVYVVEGNYTVNLTVTDDKGATAITTLQGSDIADHGVAVTQVGPGLWIAVGLALLIGLALQGRKLFN